MLRYRLKTDNKSYLRKLTRDLSISRSGTYDKLARSGEEIEQLKIYRTIIH